MCTLQGTHNHFTLTDMRLFHHYLTTAYPHFPVGSESIWLNYITPIGHQVHIALDIASGIIESW